MADHVDIQYANLLSGRFDQYRVKQQHPLKINFRCPICGDSKKSKVKARAWIVEIPKTGHLHFSCFNCGSSDSFLKFLKNQDQALYNQYITHKYIGNVLVQNVEKIEQNVEEPKYNNLSKLKKISQLNYDHPAKKYVESRKIPFNKHYRIYYTPKFMTWVNSILPGKFKDFEKDEPRLILPLINKNKELIGVSARSFANKSLRYITIMFMHDQPKIFGLDEIDFDKTYFVVEGAIDSLFLSNSIAMVGADISLTGLSNLENAIFIHDNEPRNLQICKRMEKLLKSGKRVCIWPVTKGKDINDMYLNETKEIEKIILNNTYSGLSGLLKLADWKKCS